MMTLEEAREFFAQDRYATELTGITVEEIAEHFSVCRLALTEKHRNAVGGVMGGVVYTLCDFAFAVATNDAEHHVVTVVSQISYLSAAKGSTLYATANMVKDGRRTCFYTVTVTDELGTQVAVASTTGMHVG